MANNLTIAWATPVDIVKLGARLEAYVDRKAAISTLKLCVQYAPFGSSLAQLPPEVIGFIGSYMQEAVFASRFKSWLSAWKCCQDYCLSQDHVKKPEVADVAIQKRSIRWNPTDNPDDPEENAGVFFECSNHDPRRERMNIHHHRIRYFLEKLSQQDEPSKHNSLFGRCREVFSQDFKLELFFTTLLHYESPYLHKGIVATPLAYIVSSSVQTGSNTILGTNGTHVGASLPPVFLGQSILRKPELEEILRFRKALNALKLEPGARDCNLYVKGLQRTSIGALLPEPSSEVDTGNPSRPIEPSALQPTRNLGTEEWPRLMVLMNVTLSGSDEAASDSDVE